MNEEKNHVYTLPLDYLREILDESEKQAGVSEDLLQQLFSCPPENYNLISIVVEILWSNFAILKILDQEINTAVLRKNETTGEEEFLVMEATMLYLQQLILAKHYANQVLTSISYSVSLH